MGHSHGAQLWGRDSVTPHMGPIYGSEPPITPPRDPNTPPIPPPAPLMGQIYGAGTPITPIPPHNPTYGADPWAQPRPTPLTGQRPLPVKDGADAGAVSAAAVDVEPRGQKDPILHCDGAVRKRRDQQLVPPYGAAPLRQPHRACPTHSACPIAPAPHSSFQPMGQPHCVSPIAPAP